MANYLFETMTDAQAVAYDPSADDLFFLSGDASTVGVTYNPAAGLSTASITLTSGTISHTFVADALANEDLTFFNGSSDDTLAFGSSTGEAATVVGVADAGARYYAFGGDDTVDGSVANDTIYGGLGDDSINGSSGTTDTDGNFTESDYLNGGVGADTINGGLGNDHIYGNSFDAVAGTTDGNDLIDAGNGNDYVNGNAGDDTIFGGFGNDKVYGGAGDDSIEGNDGNDYLQGNKGDDTLLGGNGADVIHGGADNDALIGGNGNDQLFGDNGNDNLSGGVGFDTLSGGAGNDVFSFATAGDSSFTNLHASSTVANHGMVDTITDFADGSDTIHLTFVPAAAANVQHGVAGATFSDAGAAQDYAQTLLTGHNSDVIAVTVGADTYLFYNDTHAADTINAAIKVVGVTDAAFTNADFA